MKKLSLYSIFFLMFFASLKSFATEPGDKAPTCSLVKMIGNENINLVSYRGHVLYIDFWASWCPPCVKSFPQMNRLNQAFKDKGLQIIGINLDEIPEDAISFLKTNSAEFMITSDPNQRCAKDFDVKAMPSSYLIDSKGIIREIYLGARNEQAEVIHKKIQQLLQEASEDQANKNAAGN